MDYVNIEMTLRNVSIYEQYTHLYHELYQPVSCTKYISFPTFRHPSKLSLYQFL